MKKPQSISIDPEVWDKFKQECENAEDTPSRRVSILIKKWLKEVRSERQREKSL